MRAVVLETPGPVENLLIRDLPLPIPGPDWVRIRVKAFGLNRSEYHTRVGLAQGVTFPRVLGITSALRAVAIIAAAVVLLLAAKTLAPVFTSSPSDRARS